MANKPISTPNVTMGRHGRIHEQEAEREKGVTFGEPHPAPKTETSREERIAAGIETPPKPHPKPQSFQQPERKAETPPSGPPLTRAELVGAVDMPVDARTVQQAEAARLHDLEQAEVAKKKEAQRKQAEADAKARTNQTVAKK